MREKESFFPAFELLPLPTVTEAFCQYRRSFRAVTAHVAILFGMLESLDNVSGYYQPETRASTVSRRSVETTKSPKPFSEFLRTDNVFSPIAHVVILIKNFDSILLPN